MKNYIFTLLIAGFALISCNNDLEINAPWEDVTVIYGILNQGKDTNWVRIHRGYLGDEGIYGGNQEPDSLYYENLVVTIDEYNANGGFLNSYSLLKVTEQDNLGVKLDSGFFTTKGYRLYLLNASLNPDNTYTLNVAKPDGEGGTVTSSTLLVDDFNITKPIGQQKLTFGRNGQEFIWEEASYARLYQSYLRFYYVEINANNPADSVRLFVDYQLPSELGSSLDGNGKVQNTVGYETFYRYLGNAIPTNENVIRFFRGMDLYVVAAGDDLTTYISVSQPSDGIVQDKPFYTNITNGAGIFSSLSNQEKLGMYLSSPSLDSLVKGSFTCKLNFGRTDVADTCVCATPGKFLCY